MVNKNFIGKFKKSFVLINTARGQSVILKDLNEALKTNKILGACLDVLEIEFEAEWERSLYLALRIFSDSDGSSYGNVGYHLSFSNNRINLQSNRKVKGRTIRETLGSILVDAMVGVKKADFKISAQGRKTERNDYDIAILRLDYPIMDEGTGITVLQVFISLFSSLLPGRTHGNVLRPFCFPTFF